MTWINKDGWNLRKPNIKLDLNIDTHIKSYDEYLEDTYQYKIGKLYQSLVGIDFMCYDGDKLVTKKVKEVKFNVDIVYDEERKKYVENKRVGLNDEPIKNDYTGYKLFVFLVSEDNEQYNLNDVYLKHIL